jgi:RNA polymerase sigma factor (sigma-70 family)
MSAADNSSGRGEPSVKTVHEQEERPRPGAGVDAARKRAAVETYSRNEAALRRTARRYSLCADDAEDALQRGLEILLRKAPTDEPRELIKWTQTVVKHEALAVRRERERLLAGPAAAKPEADAPDWVSLIPADAAGPAEQTERREAIARSREALQALKPQELRALTLLAEGYSYAEIGEITGYSRTKINRCLAEGRERFRKLLSRSEDGRRCVEMRPLISSFCDGEASEEEVDRLREHLRACAHCRATLRAYRAAPAAAAALAPTLPLHRSLLERAYDAIVGLASRAAGSGVGDVAATGGTGASASGLGVAGLVKAAAALCAGGAGGAIACVAVGLLPAPHGLASDRAPQPSLERRHEQAPQPQAEPAEVDYTPEATPPAPTPQPASPHHEAEPRQEETIATEAAPAPEAAPAVPSEPVEYAPPPAPEPVAEPAPSAATSGSPAGEFGP